MELYRKNKRKSLLERKKARTRFSADARKAWNRKQKLLAKRVIAAADMKLPARYYELRSYQALGHKYVDHVLTIIRSGLHG